jgi:hypothetical protein
VNPFSPARVFKISPPLNIENPKSLESSSATVVFPTAGQPEMTMLRFFAIGHQFPVRLGMVVFVTFEIIPLNANEVIRNQPHKKTSPGTRHGPL